ncbi:MAG: tyrosine-type recombinase/integrase [Desulforhopalus sp.]
MYFHVAPSGKKTWRYRFKIDGKESTFTLGEYPQMTLEQARSKRVVAREQVKGGINPGRALREANEVRKAEKEAERNIGKTTFEFVALEWIELQRERWSKDHSNAVLDTLRRDAFPMIGDHQIDTIPPPVVLKVLRKIESRGALEIANKVLQRMSAVFRYAVQTGLATYNPASDMRGVIKTRKVLHRAALDEKELPEFLYKLTTADLNVTTRLALQFTILTATRSGEVRGAVWDEINLEDRIWKIPAERMKMATPHNVPLSKQAVRILERVGKLYGQSSLVFPGIRDHNKKLSENTLLYALYRMGYHSRATVHGFRAVFSTIANETGWNGDVIEKALAHEQRNKVRAAYHRSEYLEQRRELMQWWADHLDGFLQEFYK